MTPLSVTPLRVAPLSPSPLREALAAGGFSAAARPCFLHGLDCIRVAPAVHGSCATRAHRFDAPRGQRFTERLRRAGAEKLSDIGRLLSTSLP